MVIGRKFLLLPGEGQDEGIYNQAVALCYPLSPALLPEGEGVNGTAVSRNIKG